MTRLAYADYGADSTLQMFRIARVSASQSIGIDDALSWSHHEDMQNTAAEFEGLFRDVYLAFHRRDGRRAGLSGASRAVLTHLSLAGPVTIGEAASHLDRAQSVVSDIVTQLASKGYLERRADPDDRRRILVWLTPAGAATLRDDANVLSESLLVAAIQTMPAPAVAAMLNGLRDLVARAPHPVERNPQ
jgi:DNA-binding MarR family transcriptional regulator